MAAHPQHPTGLPPQVIQDATVAFTSIQRPEDTIRDIYGRPYGGDPMDILIVQQSPHYAKCSYVGPLELIVVDPAREASLAQLELCEGRLRSQALGIIGAKVMFLYCEVSRGKLRDAVTLNHPNLWALFRKELDNAMIKMVRAGPFRPAFDLSRVDSNFKSLYPESVRLFALAVVVEDKTILMSRPIYIMSPAGSVEEPTKLVGKKRSWEAANAEGADVAGAAGGTNGEPPVKRRPPPTPESENWVGQLSATRGVVGKALHVHAPFAKVPVGDVVFWSQTYDREIRARARNNGLYLLEYNAGEMMLEFNPEKPADAATHKPVYLIVTMERDPSIPPAAAQAGAAAGDNWMQTDTHALLRRPAKVQTPEDMRPLIDSYGRGQALEPAAAQAYNLLGVSGAEFARLINASYTPQTAQPPAFTGAGNGAGAGAAAAGTHSQGGAPEDEEMHDAEREEEVAVAQQAKRVRGLLDWRGKLEEDSDDDEISGREYIMRRFLAGQTH